MAGRSAVGADLGRELRSLFRDTEELLHALGPEQSDAFAAARDSLTPALRWGTVTLRRAQHLLRRHARAALWLAAAATALGGACLLRAQRRIP